MQVAGRVIPSIYLVAGLVVVTALVSGFLFTYQSSVVEPVRFNTIYWSGGGNSGPGPLRDIPNQPGVNLVVKSSDVTSKVWDYVANDNVTLTRFWQENIVEYYFPEPTVDFSSTTALAVISWGARSGYQINVTRI